MRRAAARWTAAGLALALVLLAGLPRLAGASVAMRVQGVGEAHFLPQPGGAVFMLALGTDGRPGLDGDRADAIHLIGVNPSLGAATILDIPRDTFVEIPGHGRRKINDGYFLGGARLQAQAVSRLTGVPVSLVVSVGFDGFRRMVDELGGVEVDVPIAMNDRFSGARFPRGRVRMDGAQALAFARNRQVPDGDLRRTEHQGRLILAALAKLRASGLGPSATIRHLAVLGRHTKIEGVSVPDLYRYARLALSLDGARVRNVVMPSRIGFAGAASVVHPAAGAASLFADLADDGVLQRH